MNRCCFGLFKLRRFLGHACFKEYRGLIPIVMKLLTRFNYKSSSLKQLIERNYFRSGNVTAK